jgi:hypothetical protein
LQKLQPLKPIATFRKFVGAITVIAISIATAIIAIAIMAAVIIAHTITAGIRRITDIVIIGVPALGSISASNAFVRP